MSQSKQPGLNGRHRNNDGATRAKNGNTKVETLRQTYGDDFAAGRRSDMHLSTLLDREGVKSLNDLLEKK